MQTKNIIKVIKKGSIIENNLTWFSKKLITGNWFELFVPVKIFKKGIIDATENNSETPAKIIIMFK